MRCRSNWNLKMLVFEERRKPEYPEENRQFILWLHWSGERRRGRRRGILHVMTISSRLYCEARGTFSFQVAGI